MKNGNGHRPIQESEIVQRLQRYRKRLLEEMSFPHYSEDTKNGIRYCLKWLDKIILNRD